MARGSIRQRTKGSWTLTYDLPPAPDGSRRQKSVTIRCTKREAEAELARILNELQTGTHVEPSRTTLAEYLARWQAHAARSLAANSVRAYDHAIRRLIVPALGSVPLARLTALDIDTAYGTMLDEGRSPAQMRIVHAVLHQSLRQAVVWRLIRDNPAAHVRAPRVEAEDRGVLTPEQTRTLLDAARGDWIYIPIALAVGTGMRRGEILGLPWRNVDLAGGWIHVRQAIVFAGDGWQFAAPKTKAGIRSIKAPGWLVEDLRAHRVDQDALRAFVGSGYADHDLVVASEFGLPRSDAGFRGAFLSALKRAGLPPMHFHDLRHGHATLLLADGNPLKAVSERLGHASASITNDLYNHVVPVHREHMADTVERHFGGTWAPREHGPPGNPSSRTETRPPPLTGD